jgi:cell division protein FtsB
MLWISVAKRAKPDYKQKEGASIEMNRLFRRLGVIVAIAIVGAYAFVALRGPRGVPAFLEKRKEIRALEEQNANLAREIQRKRERIERLKHSPSEQEMEIRRQLKLLRPGETSFILPDAPAQKDSPAPKDVPPPAQP